MRKLGGIYVLGGLTMVNSHAAMAFPMVVSIFCDKYCNNDSFIL